MGKRHFSHAPEGACPPSSRAEARRDGGCGIPAADGRAGQPPILPCTGWGFSCRRHCWRTRWALTPPFHPYRHWGSQISNLKFQIPQSRRYVLCDTFRRRVLTRTARACGEACTASCPAVSGLSSPGSKNTERRFRPRTRITVARLRQRSAANAGSKGRRFSGCPGLRKGGGWLLLLAPRGPVTDWPYVTTPT